MNRLYELGPVALCFVVALVAACKDEGGSDPYEPPEDLTAQTPDAGNVEYMGPARGGAIPVGPELDAGQGDDGPFEVDTACCEATLAIAAVGDETRVSVRGDLPPLDGDGLTAELDMNAYVVETCMPAGVAVRYRFEVERTGSTETEYVTDGSQPTEADEDGELWNVSVVSCGDAGT